MAARMAATGARHLWLDATSVPAEHLERRFPTILARCRAAGIDPSRQPIPVSPAAHYLMGGVVTDLDGRTSLPGLFAVGEAACTGVHGANRLALQLPAGGRGLRRPHRPGPGPGAVDNPAHPPHPFGYAPPPGPGSGGSGYHAPRYHAARPGAVPGASRRGCAPVRGPGTGRLGEGAGAAADDRQGRGGAVGGGLAEAMGELERLTVDLATRGRRCSRPPTWCSSAGRWPSWRPGGRSRGVALAIRPPGPGRGLAGPPDPGQDGRRRPRGRPAGRTRGRRRAGDRHRAATPEAGR